MRMVSLYHGAQSPRHVCPSLLEEERLLLVAAAAAGCGRRRLLSRGCGLGGFGCRARARGGRGRGWFGISGLGVLLGASVQVRVPAASLQNEGSAAHHPLERDVRATAVASLRPCVPRFLKDLVELSALLAD